MDRIEMMQTFVRVAELGSFSRAAEQLGLPKATVSNAIRQLEERINARLMHRTTRRVELTNDGAVYLASCRDVLAEIDELDSMFQQTATGLKGRIRMDCPQGAARQILPHLPDFLKQHPQLEIELCSNDHRVDLIREGFDCVLRAGYAIDDHLIAKAVGVMPLSNCVSVGYAQVFGVPKTLEDLGQHRIIHYGTAPLAKQTGFEYFRDGKTHFIPMSGPLSVNNTDAYTAACLAGFGLIQVPTIGAKVHIEAGRMIEVLPDHRPEPMTVSLVYIHRRHQPLRLRVFMDWLSTILKDYYVSTKSI